MSELSSCLARLRAEVIEAGRCVACGGCLDLCPHLIFYDGRVAAPDPCDLTRGRCYDLCPQVPRPPAGDLRRRLHQNLGNAYQPPLGPVQEVWQARAQDPRVREAAQYGGVVSTLVALALETGLVGEAVLTRRGERGAPEGCRVRGPGEVLACAGSLYAAAGTLSRLHRALAQPEEDHPLALVGLPCQVTSARLAQDHPDYPQARRLRLVIGLFCTWNLDARGLRALLAHHGVVGPVRKYDIPPPPAEVFLVEHAGGRLEIPLAEVRRHTLAGCSRCPDMTAELADVSVGAVEGRPGWNTLLVRTAAGAELVAQAQRQGRLTLEPAEPAALEHLTQAAQAKHQRAAQVGKEG